MPRRAASAPKPATPPPPWLRRLLPIVCALLLIGLFSGEIADPDFWWHLKTGQYLAEKHSLPVPDPFAYTTALAKPVYSGEERTREFNLTHEWLAQLLLYGVYAMGGFPAVVVARALMLTAFCAVAGLVVYWRRGDFMAALLAAFAAATVAWDFAADRPFQVTFLCLALTLLLVETRRWLWLLPALFAVWANCHGGYFLGWVVLGAYAAEAVVRRRRDAEMEYRRQLWLVSVLCVLVCGLNPNGWKVFAVLADYRESFLTNKLLEWTPPSLWPPQAFSVLLLGALAALLWARGKARPADWLLFAVFTLAALSAQRNVILIGLLAPILIASYAPSKLRFPVWGEFGVLLLATAGLAAGVERGSFFQLRATDWRYPAGAANFLEVNHIQGRMFNTYEYGGYLLWRLWPGQRVFIDGRALSESVFQDYGRILYNHDETGGPSGEELLDRYGVDVIVMNSFEPSTGAIYVLAPALADPQQSKWKLVYHDPEALVFVRQLPPGMRARPSLEVLSHMEDECSLHIAREPQYTRCARGLGQVFSKIGDAPRARRWIGEYLSHPHPPDPEADQAYRQLLSVR